MAATPPNLIERLRNSLLEAFPTRGELAQLVRFKLDENLDKIVSDAKSMSDTVFNLLTWAEAHGRLAELATAAAQARLGRGDLQELALGLEEAAR